MRSATIAQGSTELMDLHVTLYMLRRDIKF